ncbi:MAG: hypothetical protein FJW92_06800, partial [Actinobacteria bacterium]|nr:hypothetical protein [Actinomycetota bacterium]
MGGRGARGVGRASGGPRHAAVRSAGPRSHPSRRASWDPHHYSGSGVVHVTGAFAGLAGAIVVGARIGKCREGRPQPIPGVRFRRRSSPCCS